MASGPSSFYSSLMAPPPKRKRFSINTPEEAQCSIIKDRRVTPSQSLKLSCPILTVLVGPSDNDNPATSFSVHEAAICDRSPFFANAMKPEWASLRSDPKTIELPDDDPAAFGLYMSFLYSGQLPILQEANSQTTTDSEELNENYNTLAYAYVLGERLMDVPFKNAISDTYVLCARGTAPAPPNAAAFTIPRRYPSNEEIRIIYSGTTDSSPLRRLIVDIWSCRGKFDWIDQDSDLPAEFLAEVVKALLKLRPNDSSTMSLSRPWKNTHEQYHEKPGTET